MKSEGCRNIGCGFCIAFTLLVFIGCSSGNGTPAQSGTGTVAPAPAPNVNKPFIVAAVTSGAEIATNQGLRALAKTNAPAAAETAQALRVSINTTLLPYLQGNPLASSAVIHDLLNSSLFTNVNPAIRNAIAVAGSLLDAYLPAPSATSYLSDDQRDYVVAFLNGIQKGCADFQAKALTGPRWIEEAPEATK